MTDLAVLLQRLTIRYHRALLARAAVWAVLGLSGCALAAWRAQSAGVPAWVAWGVPAAGAAATAGALSWWLRRRWLTGARGAAFLDRTLVLDQRLVTAEEFAGVEPTPALYARLLEETERRIAEGRLGAPRPVDRAAVIAALLLLILLLWPVRSSRLQVASRPVGMPPTPPAPEAADDAGTGGAGADQESRGGSDGTTPSPGGGDGEQPQDQSGRGEPSRGGPGGEGDARRPAQDGDGQQESAQGSGAGQRPSDQAQDGRAASGAQAQQPAGAGRQDQRQASAGKSESRGVQSAQAASAPAASGQGQQAGASPGLSAGQEALQQDIQQLLKEMSSELKQLEQDMAAQEHQPLPPPGTATDPELFDDQAALDPGTVSSDGIRVQTDDARVSRERPGGGVGQASGDVAAAQPKAARQAAGLADAPEAEGAVASRPVVPPEYRQVFDRLQQPEPQPSEKSP